MNKENAHLYLPLVQALAEGKTIQWKSNEGVWMDLEEIDCAYDDPSCCRIKPEPRTFEIYVRGSGQIVDGYDHTHAKRQGYERITVQEVLG